MPMTQLSRQTRRTHFRTSALRLRMLRRPRRRAMMHGRDGPRQVIRMRVARRNLAQARHLRGHRQEQVGWRDERDPALVLGRREVR
jgi:hypothetical protein